MATLALQALSSGGAVLVPVMATLLWSLVITDVLSTLTTQAYQSPSN